MAEETIREQLRQWRQAHPHATFDEIDAEVARQYAALHAEVVAELSTAAAAVAGDETGEGVVRCAQCQTPMQRRGARRRRIPTRRGVEAEVARTYYVCPACGAGLFPPR
jgi:hypothetical protein